MRRNLTCWQCKLPVLVKNIGEERKKFPGAEMQYLCRTCQRENIKEKIRVNRKMMGLRGRR